MALEESVTRCVKKLICCGFVAIVAKSVIVPDFRVIWPRESPVLFNKLHELEAVIRQLSRFDDDNICWMELWLVFHRETLIDELLVLWIVAQLCADGFVAEVCFVQY